MLDEQQQIPHELSDSLARIGSAPSPHPQTDELLPEINQVNEREKMIINDDSDIYFNVSQTTNGVEITNNNDDNSEVLSKDRLARILQNKAPTKEIDADVLEQYPSFTADININETDKNIKQQNVFGTLSQLPPDNDTVYIDHDKK